MEDTNKNTISLSGDSAKKNPIDKQNGQSEFAEKEPLIEPRTIQVLKKIGIGFGFFILLLVIGSIVYRFIPKGSQIAIVETPIEEKTVAVETENKSYFAYIKDTKAIWISDLNGENKEMVLSIPPSSEEVFSTITWKSPKDLTYVICDKDYLNCSIRTLNIESSSVNDEYLSKNYIKKIAWDKTSNYIGFIEEKEINNRSRYAEYSTYNSFTLKTGTIINPLNTFNRLEDPGNTNSRVIFSDDNQYVVFYSVSQEIQPVSTTQFNVDTVPIIEVYLLNGTKIDRIAEARDPFFITENKLGYVKDGKIVYKTIGLEDETIATAFNGSTPAISPDKNQIAYWYTEGNLNNVVLGIFDTNLNIHRNILRGIVLPTWISNDKILGIKADNCLQGTSCQLYQFQTNSISLVDVRRGNVVQVDQGKKISEPSFVFFRK